MALRRRHETARPFKYVEQFLEGNTVQPGLGSPGITRHFRHWRPVRFTNESRFHASACDRRGKGVKSVTPSAQHHGGGCIKVWVSSLWMAVRICKSFFFFASHWQGRSNSCEVSRWSPLANCEIFWRCCSARFHPDARYYPKTHSQSRHSVPGSGRNLCDGLACPITELESNRISVRHAPPQTVQTLTEEWNVIDQGSIHRMIRNMPRWCRGWI